MSKGGIGLSGVSCTNKCQTINQKYSGRAEVIRDSQLCNKESIKRLNWKPLYRKIGRRIGTDVSVFV